MTRLRLLVLVAAALWACESAPPAVQPISYSHKAHVDSGMECQGCHQAADNAALAGVPNTETCIVCHQGAITDSAEEEKVRRYADAGEAIPWRRIHHLPDHVYFSHRRHVAVAGIECGECHGAFASLTAPPAYPLVEQSMDWCLDCHRARGATEDCIHCHR